jgi:hypothetical protein
MVQQSSTEEELKKQKRPNLSAQVNFLSYENIDCLMLDSVCKLGKVSEEEFSVLCNLLQILFRNINRPFTPFYSCQECLDNLVREGRLFQIGISKPEFKSNPEAVRNVENELKKILSEGHYRIYREVINELSRTKDRLTKLYGLEKAAIAYEKLPEHLKIDFIKSSAYVQSEYQAKRLLSKIEGWIKSGRYA